MSIAISSDDRYVVSGSSENSIRLWNIETKTFKLIGKHDGWVTSVDISKNNLFIASGSRDGTLRIWDIQT